MSETRSLFGGAITTTVPKGFIDASDFRQVPDNQEVFVRQDSDSSLIVEVLQLATNEGAGDSLENAVRFHFGSLAHDNSALSSNVEQVRGVNSTQVIRDTLATPSPILLVGTQTVKKFGKQSEPTDLVRIHLALWRLPSKNIDLVMSLNEPLGLESAGLRPSKPEVVSAFEQAANSLKINDWSLFA